MMTNSTAAHAVIAVLTLLATHKVWDWLIQVKQIYRSDIKHQWSFVIQFTWREITAHYFIWTGTSLVEKIYTSLIQAP